MPLASNEIRRRVVEEKLISDYQNLDEQVQVNGFDLTITKIEKPITPSLILKKGKFLPQTIEVPLSNMITEITSGEAIRGWNLPVGSYLATINETINLPKDLCAIVIQRSTLARSEVYHSCSFWDAGYNGKGTVSIIVDNPTFLEKDARAVQMIFLEVQGEGKLYNGQYQKENIKDVSQTSSN